jgi:hypothetical protein
MCTKCGCKVQKKGAAPLPAINDGSGHMEELKSNCQPKFQDVCPWKKRNQSIQGSSNSKI